VIRIQKNGSANTPLVVAFLAISTLVSCATNPDLEDGPIPSNERLLPPPLPPLPEDTSGGSEAAVGTVQPTQTEEEIQGTRTGGGVFERNSINDPGHPLARRIIFFDYNSAEIAGQAVELLQLHSEYLSRFRDVRVRLEGHTDERGSREYNIALGDNRSRSVARILQIQGVDAGQFSTLSYGEEVPLDEGQSEASYRRNRRVELVYEGLN